MAWRCHRGCPVTSACQWPLLSVRAFPGHEVCPIIRRQRLAWAVGGQAFVVATLGFNGERAGKSVNGRLRCLTTAGVAVVVVAAVSAAWVAIRVLVRRPRPSSGLAEPPIPPADLSRLTALAAQIAVAYGDREPVASSAVATTRDEALAVTVPRSTSREDRTPVYLVVMRGHFTALGWQSGAGVPRGTHLFTVVDRASFSVLDLSIGDRPPPVSLDSLGAVADLEPAHA